MEVFLMIRRKKTTIFLDAKESSKVLEVKRMIEGILKRPPKEQLLFKDYQLLQERKTLRDCGLTSRVAMPQDPARVTLAFPEDAFQVFHSNPFCCPLIEVALKNGLGTVCAEEEAVQ